jgi:thiosulfate dehydrogenase
VPRPPASRGARLAAVAAALAWSIACAPPAKPPGPPLVSAQSTMVTAWEVPRNPLTDPALDRAPLGPEIRRGFQLFMETPKRAPRLVGGGIACGNCHLNAGQRDRALPLVGIAGLFPEPNARAGRLISLPDRVVDCFNRSENAAGAAQAERPTTSSKEVLAIVAYLTWLSNGFEVGTVPPWRGHNAIPAEHLIPVQAIDRTAGEAIFREQCTSCHGADGQGVQIGDKKAAPLWGQGSWNDGAGAARVYTLAGIIRYSMPYLNPGSLTDEQAQQVAAFITSQPRPAYPDKPRDYPSGKIPPDAVYYRR